VTKDKKDLTRIEDLGDFIHELDEVEEESLEMPSLPEEDEPSEDFSTSFGEETEFESSFEEPTEELSFEAEIEPESEPELEPEEETTIFDELPALEEETEEEISFEPEPDYQPEPEPEPVLETYRAPETFSEVKTFAESSFSSEAGAEANPSFSVLIKNVKFIEDVHDIVSLLKEFNLLSDSEEITTSRLSRGSLLVPRISEFAAIYLSHKLRRFDIDIHLGFSDEIHPPKHQEAPELGLVSRHNLYQNQTHQFHFDDPKLELSQIIVAATSTLEGYQIIRYVGVASEHKLLDGQLIEDENSPEISGFYQELAQKLKAHAIKAQANAVVGLTYQLTPIPSEYGASGQKYRLTCTGNLVWVSKT
jgi:uncharacterized protein YbjQ (UPF0145 family)